MSVVAVAAHLMRVQHGAVSRAQLLALGVTVSAIRRAAERGEILRLSPEVYADAGSPDTWRRRLMVATLDGGPGSAASHRAAAKLLVVAHRDAPELVEVSVPRGRTYRMREVIVHSPLDLVDDHVTTIDGIPCTNILRTLVDLGGAEPIWAVKDALERALQAKLCTVRGVEWMLAELSERGRTGCGVIREVLTERELTARSPHKGLLEPRYAGLSKRFGLPPYSYQHKVFDASGLLVAQIDFAYPVMRVGIEVDGFETHGTPAAMEKDFERDDKLEIDHGWRIIHFTWHQVLKRPDYVARRVRQVLAAREALLGV